MSECREDKFFSRGLSLNKDLELEVDRELRFGFFLMKERLEGAYMLMM